ncbi:MAG TPA: histidine phosphatase family protein [Nitrososphaeraceae archaeon]|nr:histidine phosphatase family protein [Nitrososphaeraceae archaeon]
MPLAIFMRHGEADNNVNRILVGRHIESHLTEIGRQQVRDTANYLKEIVVDKVFVSPVIRARETAEIVCDVNNLDYEIDERLYEIELGKLVGMNYEDIIEKHGNLFLKFYSGDEQMLDDYGVESFTSVKMRIKHLLDEAMERYPDKNIIFVTHLDPIKAAISLLLDLKPEALYQWHIRNAALTILKHESKIFSLSGVNVMGLDRYLKE